MMKRLRLGDYITQIRGVSYKPADVCAKNAERAVPLLRANNIQDSGLNYEDLVYVDESRVSNEQYVQPGDIVICTSSGSKNLVGKAALVQSNTKCAFGAFCKVVRSAYINKHYLGQFFRSPYYRQTISEVSAGANINNIRNEHIDNLLIPLPSTERQVEIAEELGLIDSIIHDYETQCALVDQLVKSRFIEMFGDPEDNNKGWPLQPLGNLCTVGSSKRIYQEEQSASGVPFWRISDLVCKLDTGMADSALYIPEERYSELKQAGLAPVAGDILITSRGTLGRCYIIKDEDRFYFQDGMISWLSNYSDSITPLYLQHLFTISGFRKQIDNMQAGSTVAYLSIAMLKKLLVMVPDIDLQNAFSAFIEQTDKSKFSLKNGGKEAHFAVKCIWESLCRGTLT